MATTGSYDAGALRVTLTAAGTTAGDVASIANPEGAAVIITRAILNITTASTGASTLDVGVAANATTSADNLIDGRSGATAGTFDNIEDGGTNGLATKVWGASEYVTVSEASGDVTGIAGELLIQYVTR